eukprot:6979773-Pyramimonas_sp.AAC.1
MLPNVAQRIGLPVRDADPSAQFRATVGIQQPTQNRPCRPAAGLLLRLVAPRASRTPPEAPRACPN